MTRQDAENVITDLVHQMRAELATRLPAVVPDEWDRDVSAREIADSLERAQCAIEAAAHYLADAPNTFRTHA